MPCLIVSSTNTRAASYISCCLCRAQLNWSVVSLMRMLSLHLHGTSRHVNRRVICWVFCVNRVIVTVEMMRVGTWLRWRLVKCCVSGRNSSWGRNYWSISRVWMHGCSFGGRLYIAVVTSVIVVFWTEHI